MAVFDGSCALYRLICCVSPIPAGVRSIFLIYIGLAVRQQDHKLLVAGAAVAGRIQGLVALNQSRLNIGAAGFSIIIPVVNVIVVQPAHLTGVDRVFDGGNVRLDYLAVFVEDRDQRQLLLAKTAELHNADPSVNAFGDQGIDQRCLRLLGDLQAGSHIHIVYILRTGIWLFFAFIIMPAVGTPPVVNNPLSGDVPGTAVVAQIVAVAYVSFPFNVFAAADSADAFFLFICSERCAAANAAAVNMVVHAVGVVGDQYDVDLRFYRSRAAAGNLQGHFPLVDGRLHCGFRQGNVVFPVNDRLRLQICRRFRRSQDAAGNQSNHQQNG